MARQGRRLTIGGSGVGLSDDDSLSQGSRGEVRRYVPQTEDEVRAEAARIGAGANASREEPGAGGPGTLPVIIFPEGAAGDAAATATDAGLSTAEGNISDEGTGGAPGSPGDPSGQGEGTGTGTGTGTGEGNGSDTGFKRGGKVGGKQGEHPITAQQGEWVINEAAAKKYGDRFMAALNAGKIPVMSPKAYAKGGKVGAGGKRLSVAYRGLAR